MMIQVFGQRGMLGSAVVRQLPQTGLQFEPHQADLELVAPGHIHADVVINCAGLVKQRPDKASRFMRVNAVGPHQLAEACDAAAIGAHVPDTLDALWIDTEHTADRTYQELSIWGAWVTPGGVILLHDTDDPSTAPGVRDAMEQWCSECGLTAEYHAGSYGLGVIRC